MDRKEAYAQIKKLGLAEDVKKKFGKNFTQVSTNDLVAMIEGAKKTPAKKVAAAPIVKKDTKKVEELRGAMEGTDYKAKYEEAVKVIAKFLTFMPEELLNDAATAAKTLTSEKVAKDIEFSSADIDKMFRK